jgi:DNA polymerase elongation subunit (family B)
MINILYMDIEVDAIGGFPHPEQAERKITAITLRQNGFDLVFGYEPYTPESETVKYVQCKDEIQLLQRFIRAYRQLDPDILTGWNVNTFDIPYLVNRITNLIGSSTATMLSPFNLIAERTVRQKYGREALVYDLLGVQIVDYLEAYRKFRLKERESYRLDAIAEIELEERKLDYSEYASLNELYVKDHTKFINYNIRDVALVERLERKLRFLELVILLAYRSRINFADTFHQTRIWDGLTNQFLSSKNKVVPHRKVGTKDKKYVGAYVKAPIVGMHKYVVSYDLTSLYPSLILQYNISPETIVGDMGDFDFDGLVAGTWKNKSKFALAGNGHYFRKDKLGFMTEIIADLFETRQDAKRKMLDAQRAEKKDEEAGWNTIQQLL